MRKLANVSNSVTVLWVIAVSVMPRATTFYSTPPWITDVHLTQRQLIHELTSEELFPYKFDKDKFQILSVWIILIVKQD